MYSEYTIDPQDNVKKRRLSQIILCYSFCETEIEPDKMK